MEKRREKMKVYTLTKLLPPGYWWHLFDLFLGLLIALLLGLDWILWEKNFSESVVQALEQAAQGISGVPIPGGIVNT